MSRRSSGSNGGCCGRGGADLGFGSLVEIDFGPVTDLAPSVPALKVDACVVLGLTQTAPA